MSHVHEQLDIIKRRFVAGELTLEEARCWDTYWRRYLVREMSSAAKARRQMASRWRWFRRAFDGS